MFFGKKLRLTTMWWFSKLVNDQTFYPCDQIVLGYLNVVHKPLIQGECYYCGKNSIYYYFYFRYLDNKPMKELENNEDCYILCAKCLMCREMNQCKDVVYSGNINRLSESRRIETKAILHSTLLNLARKYKNYIVSNFDKKLEPSNLTGDIEYGITHRPHPTVWEKMNLKVIEFNQRSKFKLYQCCQCLQWRNDPGYRFNVFGQYEENNYLYILCDGCQRSYVIERGEIKRSYLYDAFMFILMLNTV